MKLRIQFLLIIILGIHTNNANASQCNCLLAKNVRQLVRDNPVSTLDTLELKDLTESEFKVIRNRLCMDIITATNFGFQVERFKKVILDGLGISENSENINQVVSSFLNKYKQELVCPKDKTRKNSRNLHIYKSAIRGGVIDLFDEILLDTDEFDIDFNAYEMVDGKKETVLDYIVKCIDSGQFDNDELELLKDDIIDAGGKRGNEL